MTKAHPVEGDVKNAVKKLLATHGWYAFMPPANQYGANGISDIIAVKDGLFLAVEVKLKKDNGSANQEAFMKSVRAHGGLAMLVNMKGLPAFADWLAMFDRVSNGTTA